MLVDAQPHYRSEGVVQTPLLSSRNLLSSVVLLFISHQKIPESQNPELTTARNPNQPELSKSRDLLERWRDISRRLRKQARVSGPQEDWNEALQSRAGSLSACGSFLLVACFSRGGNTGTANGFKSFHLTASATYGKEWPEGHSPAQSQEAPGSQLSQVLIPR